MINNLTHSIITGNEYKNTASNFLPKIISRPDYLRAEPLVQNQLVREPPPEFINIQTQHIPLALITILQIIIAIFIIFVLTKTLANKKTKSILVVSHFFSVNLLLFFSQGWLLTISHFSGNPKHLALLIVTCTIMTASTCYQSLAQLVFYLPTVRKLILAGCVTSIGFMTGIIFLPSSAESLITWSLCSATLTFLLTLAGLLYCACNKIQSAIHNLAGAGTVFILLILSLLLKPLPISTITTTELFLLTTHSLFLAFILYYQCKSNSQKVNSTDTINQPVISRRLFESALRQHLQKPDTPSNISDIPNRVLSTLEALLPKIPALIITYHDKQETINSSDKLFFAALEKQLLTLKQDIKSVINSNEDKRINLKDGNYHTFWLLPLDIDNDSQTILILAPAASKDSFSYWQTTCDVASHSRTLYQASRQSRHWQIQACLDPLTGVLNRRAFAQEADTHLQCTNNDEQPDCCLLFIDLDDFKQINDQYGHPKGDLVLLNIAKIFNQNIRQGDLLCRYGGEEFIILLPGANPNQAWQVAERIRKAIEKSTATSNNTTVSIGLSALNSNTPTLPQLIQEADQALYKAKHLGKNQIITAESCNNFRLP